MKILSKEFAVRFYALVFHMVQGEKERARGFWIHDTISMQKCIINLRTFSG